MQEEKPKVKKFSKQKLIKIIVPTVVAVLIIVITVLVAIFNQPSASRHTSVLDREPYESTASGGYFSKLRDASRVRNLKKLDVPDYVTVDYLKIGNARSGKDLSAINGIVIHYVGNPNTTAQQNRSYFGQESTEVCSHFIVGLDGEIIQCVPLNERSASSNHRNTDTISIEVCHPDESGAFTAASYLSLVEFTAWLCKNADISVNDIIRHHDVTGKDCPRYYVANPDKWELFKADVKARLESAEV